MKKKLRILSTAMAVILAFTMIGTAPSVSATEAGPPKTFSDVPDDFWAKEEIDFMSSQGYLIGKTDGTFGPTDKIMRKTVALLLYRLVGSPDTIGETLYFYSGHDRTYSDTIGDTYFNAIRWCSAAGIVNGYDDGSFRPDTTISRQHFAVMLYRYALYKGYIMEGASSKTLDIFPDAGAISASAYDACLWAYRNGLITGRSDGTFDPQGATTRAQLAVIMTRFLEAVSNADLHSHVCVPIEQVLRTCTEMGYDVWACECGYQFTTVWPASHANRTWEYLSEPTPEAPGMKYRRCSECGFEEYEEIPYVEVTPIDIEAAMAYGNQYAHETYGWTVDFTRDASNSGYNYGTTVFAKEGQEGILRAVRFQADLLYREKTANRESMGYNPEEAQYRGDGIYFRFNIYLFEPEMDLYIVELYYA